MKSLEFYKSLEYDIVIKREELDGEKWYVAYCNELGMAACHGIGDTREEAVNSYLEEKDAFLELLYSRGEAIPEPSPADNSYSGIFSVRTSPWLHSLIANQAKKNDVSINSYLNQILAYCVGQEAMCERFDEYCQRLTVRLSEQYNSIMGGIDDIQYSKPELKKQSASIYKLSA